jgi:hypothetical protein
LTAQLCGNGAGVNLAGRRLSFKVYFDSITLIDPLGDSSSFFAFASGATGCSSVGPGFVPDPTSTRTWVTEQTTTFDSSTNPIPCLTNVVNSQAITSVSIWISLDQIWDGFIYLDDVAIQ